MGPSSLTVEPGRETDDIGPTKWQQQEEREWKEGNKEGERGIYREEQGNEEEETHWEKQGDNEEEQDKEQGQGEEEERQGKEAT